MGWALMSFDPAIWGGMYILRWLQHIKSIELDFYILGWNLYICIFIHVSPFYT